MDVAAAHATDASHLDVREDTHPPLVCTTATLKTVDLPVASARDTRLKHHSSQVASARDTRLEHHSLCVSFVSGEPYFSTTFVRGQICPPPVAGFCPPSANSASGRGKFCKWTWCGDTRRWAGFCPPVGGGATPSGQKPDARTGAKTLKVQLVQLVQDQAQGNVVGAGMLVDGALMEDDAADCTADSAVMSPSTSCPLPTESPSSLWSDSEDSALGAVSVGELAESARTLLRRLPVWAEAQQQTEEETYHLGTKALQLFGVRFNARTGAKTLKVQLLQLQDQAQGNVVGAGMLVDDVPMEDDAAGDLHLLLLQEEAGSPAPLPPPRAQTR